MEHSLVSTPLEFHAAHWFLFMPTVAVSPSERQCHLVDTGSLVLVPNNMCISYHIPVDCLSLHRSNVPCEDSKACE